MAMLLTQLEPKLGSTLVQLEALVNESVPFSIKSAPMPLEIN
jgi:hypothetical protein